MNRGGVTAPDVESNATGAAAEKAAEPGKQTGGMRREIFSAGIYTAGSYAATMLNPLKGFVLAVMFAPNAYSVIIAFTSTLGWFSYADLGIFDGQNRRIPTLRGAGRYAEARHVAAVAQGATYGLAAAFGVLAAIIATLQASGAVVGSWEFTAALGAGIISQQVSGFPNSLCYAERRFREQGYVRAATAVIDFGFGVGAAYLFGISGAIVALIVVTLIEAAMFHAAFRAWLRPIWKPRQALSLMRIGLPIQAIWFAQTNMVSVDKFVTLAWLGRDNLALYALAGATASVGTLIPSTISGMFAPRIFEWIGAGRDVLKKVDAVLDITTALCVLVIPISIVCLPEATHLLLPKYESGVTAAQILVAATALLTGSGALTPYLIGTDRAPRLAGLVLLNAGINFVIDIGIVHLGFGIAGIALGSLISYAWLAVAIHVWALPAHMWWRRLLKTFVPLVFAMLIGVVASHMIGTRAPGVPLTLLAAVITTGLAAPMALVIGRRALASHRSPA